MALAQRPKTINRLAHRIDHASEPAVVRTDRRLRRQNFRLAPRPDPFERLKRHRQSLAVAKADNLAQHVSAVPGAYRAAAADTERLRHAGNLDQHALNGGNPPVNHSVFKLYNFVNDSGINLAGIRLCGLYWQNCEIPIS